MKTVRTSTPATTLAVSTSAILKAEEIAYAGKTFLLSGAAGTGKSTLIRKIARKLGEKCVVLSTTAASALNVGGVTVHSFFCLPFIPWTVNAKIPLTDRKIKAIEAVETIIIDEVSMLRCDTVDAIDHILRKVMGNKMPFGGKQIIFCGDLLQLPPIVSTSQMKNFFAQEYKTATPFFFKAHVFENAPLYSVKLDKNFRQRNDLFRTILNDIRTGKANYGRLGLLNRRVAEAEAETVVLTPDNRTATETNHRRLDAINKPIVSYNASITGNFTRSAAPVDIELKLKVGAQVMFCSNGSSIDDNWRNGEVGTVTALSDDIITVRKENGDHVNVMRHQWTQYDFEYKKVAEIKDGVPTGKMIGVIEKVERGTFSQFPLRLGWAITIHKSMGLTLKKAHLSFTNYFMTGQLYVALSRVRNLDDLTLERPLYARLIQPHPAVSEYDNSRVLKAVSTEAASTRKPAEAAA